MNAVSRRIIASCTIFIFIFSLLLTVPPYSQSTNDCFAYDEIIDFVDYASGDLLNEILNESETAEYIFTPFEVFPFDCFQPEECHNTTIFNSQFASSASSKINITLLYSGQFFEYIDKEIKATDHLVAIDIFERRLNGTYAQKLERISELISGGASVKSALDYCFPKLNDVVQYAIKCVSLSPVNATIKFDPSLKPMFEITGDKDGRRVDEFALYGKIYSALRQNQNPVVNIDTIPVKPEITHNDCIRATNLRARFSTDFAKSSAGRRNNIKLALYKINGTRLNSGERFSFNEIVGARSQANGFEMAKIIMDGEFIEGIGGGVCQVSTTLYNAAIRADLEITHVAPHSLPISYVAPSFDAMVSSRCDLTFENNGKMAVFIKCHINGDKAVVEIYGTPLPYTIRPRSVVTGSIEPPPSDEIIDFVMQYTEGLESGTRVAIKPAKHGLKSEGYLYYYNKRGELVNKKLIRRDSYKGIKGLYAIAP